MQRIRLWSTGLVAQVDTLLGRLENHEAVAASTLRAATRAGARARVRLQRVQRDGEALKQKREEAREAVERWQQRASELAGRDENAALECLRRRRASEREGRSLERRLEEHSRTERALASDVAAVEERLSTLRERHHVLATRESRADAMVVTPDVEMGEVFERWEMALAEREIADGHPDAPDAFEAELDRNEEEAELRAELAALRDFEVPR
ncbi:MAG: hypothetical protein AAF430_01570 [Myxococcota bacterium]